MSSAIRWRGGLVCECVKKSIEDIVEPRLKQAGIIHNSVDIFQYGYNRGGVAASAGTHDGGGVLDVAQYSDAAVKIWRECGWALWHRTPAENFSHHGHGVLIGCPHVSSGARYQVSEYKAGRNGLVSRRASSGPKVGYITWKDAYNKFRADIVKWLASQEIEDENMKKIPTRRTETQVVTTNEWQQLKLTNEDAYTITSATDYCDIVATVSLSGLTDTDSFKLRYELVDYKKGETTKVSKSYDAVTFVGHSNDWSVGQITFKAAVPKSSKSGYDSRLRLAVSTSVVGATVERVDIQGRKA